MDNWTRPDNVFGTEQLLDAILTCTTTPELKGPKTDHVPILLTLALETPQINEEPRRNWRETDWEKFNTTLREMLTLLPPPQPLASDTEFQESANCITQAILDIADQCKVNRLSRQAYLMRALPLHPSHIELKTARNLYADEITATKKQHWIDWLEDLEGNDVWTANRYATTEPTDGRRSRIPTLTAMGTDGSIIEAATNDEKS
ncbi:hypothetical protein AZE42_13675, partial [Rhizopogon vesiculosus]